MRIKVHFSDQKSFRKVYLTFTCHAKVLDKMMFFFALTILERVKELSRGEVSFYSAVGILKKLLVWLQFIVFSVVIQIFNRCLTEESLRSGFLSN